MDNIIYCYNLYVIYRTKTGIVAKIMKTPQETIILYFIKTLQIKNSIKFIKSG